MSNYFSSNKGFFNIIFRLINQLNKKRKIQLSIILVFIIISGYAELLTLSSIVPFLETLNDTNPSLNSKFFGIIAVENYSKDQIILTTSLIFISTISLTGFLKLFSFYTIGKFSAKVGTEFSSMAFHNFLNQNYDYHLNKNSSDLIASLTSRINGTVFTINSVLQILSSIFASIGLLIGLFLINWKAAFSIIFLFVLIYGTLIKYFKKEINLNSRKEDEIRVKRIKIIQECIGLIRNIILENNYYVFKNIYYDLDFNERNLNRRNLLLGGSPRFIIETIGIVFIALLGTYLTLYENSSANIIPLLGAIALSAQRLLPAFQQIYSGWVSIKTVSAGIIQLLNLLEKPPTNFSFNLKKLRFKESISLNSINFAYKNTNKKILNNISLKINRGEHIGIIGKTGSGKTTLFDLIMCLLYPSGGEILIDGKKINSANVNSWRSQIAHVPQNIYISDGTIRENIAFGIPENEIDAKLIQKCSSIAQISDFIENLPQGYYSSFGERGVKLSGGQIQRIGIARALYRKSSLLLLDEATSALDNKTEKLVLDGIQRKMSNLTLIMISHNISTLERCDRIIKIEKGNISYTPFL